MDATLIVAIIGAIVTALGWLVTNQLSTTIPCLMLTAILYLERLSHRYPQS